jgi:hypothetical protein
MAQTLRESRSLAVVGDPVGWAAQHDILLWSKQQQIMLALEKHHRVAVRSCHDSGKSYVASVIAARWLDSHPHGQARVITTAPTGMQVKGILWVEINQLHERAGLPGRVNQTEWWIGSYLAGIGRKPADYRPEAFQGLHARYILIIIDEASGVSTSLIDACETLATNANAKILMIGNPDDPQSMFAKVCGEPDKYGYHTIKISAWDTPNFTAEGPILTQLHGEAGQLLSDVMLSPGWVEGRRKAWGEDHPFWVSKVEAEFPSQDSNAICRISDVVQARVPFAERAIERGVASAHEWEGGDGPSKSSPSLGLAPVTSTSVIPALGVDVAGSEHGDETVCRLVECSVTPTGSVARVTTEWRTRSGDPEIVADFIAQAVAMAHVNQVFIDSIGVGFGIIGLVRKLLDDKGARVRVIGVNVAKPASDSKTYGNLRAELWWTVGRLMFQNGQIDTSSADNLMELEAQLLMPRYKISKGKIYVEAKDEINKRLGRSPDNADALMLAMAALITKHVGITTLNAPPNVSLINGASMAGTGLASASRMIHQSTARTFATNGQGGIR